MSEFLESGLDYPWVLDGDREHLLVQLATPAASSAFTVILRMDDKVLVKSVWFEVLNASTASVRAAYTHRQGAMTAWFYSPNTASQIFNLHRQFWTVNDRILKTYARL